MKVAALYVERGGVYDRPEIDCWPADRDARRYAGPLPVVGHPPCQRWGWHARQFGRATLGQDDGCFASCLSAVTRWGGIIEHPRSSSAWGAFGLTRPGGWGWTRGPVTPAGVTWTSAVDQGHYGHPAPKRTWLLLVTGTWTNVTPPALLWHPSTANGRVNDLSTQEERERTPAAFAALLVALATGDPAAAELGSPVTRSSPVAIAPVTGDPTRCDPSSGDLTRCRCCGGPVTSSRFGPPRVMCSERCRQRASRQARRVTRAAPFDGSRCIVDA